jgi:hypothetical protein
MSSKTIQLFDALNRMRSSKDPFNVTFCSYSSQRGTGGEIQTLVDVVISGQHRPDFNGKTDDMIALRYNKTTTVRRCHIYGILEFNGMKVKLKP